MHIHNVIDRIAADDYTNLRRLYKSIKAMIDRIFNIANVADVIFYSSLLSIS